MVRFSALFFAMAATNAKRAGAAAAATTAEDVLAAEVKREQPIPTRNAENIRDGHLRAHGKTRIIEDSLGEVTTSHENASMVSSTRILAHDRGQKVSLSGNGRTVDAQMHGNLHVITFELGNDKSNRIQIKSSPQDQELSIRKIGRNRKNGITNEDRAFLQDMINTVKPLQSGDQKSASVVDTVEVQVERLAALLREWPADLDVDYEFDKEKEMDRQLEREAGREAYETSHPIPADSPTPPGRSRQLHIGGKGNGSIQSRRSMVVTDEQGRRRLDYTTLCDQMDSYVLSTHDGWGHSRWDDDSTFYAFVSNDPECAGEGGTNFWTGSAWSCYEPDHDPNIEFAYGGCFGRCGAGCGDDDGAGTYTQDCLDHDNCVRFGHAIASFWCNDEFTAAADDALFAPNCL